MTELSHDAADDGFHEIQLSGKQLVFLFMATTVVSVVIFLCGVLVGRGVRGEHGERPTRRRRPTSGAGADAPAAQADDAAARTGRCRRRRLRSNGSTSANGSAREAASERRRVRCRGSRRRSLRSNRHAAAEGRRSRRPKPAAAERPRRRERPRRHRRHRQQRRPGVWAVQVVALTRSRGRVGSRPAAERQGLSGIPRVAAAGAPRPGLQGAGRQVRGPRRGRAGRAAGSRRKSSSSPGFCASARSRASCWRSAFRSSAIPPSRGWP